MLEDTQTFKTLLQTVIEITRAEKADEILDLIVNGQPFIFQSDYDNWNGGTHYYSISLTTDISTFIRIRDRLESIEKDINDKFDLAVRHFENHFVNKVTIIPQARTIAPPSASPHRAFSPAEVTRRTPLSSYLDKATEDELIEDVLMPLFRQIGFHRITVAGHKDKALEFGKDIWMKYMLPTQHILYFGIQAKKGKLDSAGMTKGSNNNVAEIYNQVSMMLGHEIFDPEIGKRTLVDHAFIVAGGEITKQARLWIGGKLDASKRSQIMFIDRDDILNLFVVNNVPLPPGAIPQKDIEFDDLPF